MKTWLSLIGAAALTTAMVGASLAQGVVYETSFESADDPSGSNFTLGDLNGQNGWTVEEGVANVVSGPFTPADAARYVNQQENSIISRDLDGGDASRVIVRGWYRGQGSEELQPPPNDRPIAALLGFRRVSGQFFAIAAFDGLEDDYIEPMGGDDEPIVFNNETWHKIVLSLNYDTKTYDVSVNNIPHLQDIVFRDNTVEALSGFQSFSRTGSNIDLIGFYPSEGDYDENGTSDDDEMRAVGGDPLDPSQPDGYDWRAVADFNQDRCTNFADFVYLLDFWNLYPFAAQSNINFNDFVALLENWNTGAGC